MNTRLASSLTRYFTARWHRGPKVHIAPTARDLPVPAPDDARGLYWGGAVHLVAEQPLDSMAQTLAHEAIGHHGLRQLMGSEWKHFMRHISEGVRAGEPGLQQICQHIRRTYTDDAGNYQLTARQESDEISGYLAEQLLCFSTGSIKPDRPLSQALQAVKGRVLREGLCLDRNVSRSELEGALLLADLNMQGWPWLPVRHRIRRFWRSCGNMLGMSKPNPYKPPMSMQESQRLLDGARQQELNEGRWKIGLLKWVFWAVALGLMTIGVFNGYFVSILIGVAVIALVCILDQ
ncbi:hypothetical protein [Comamonas odontotermitis]|uniref:hypothetical protein n=1 Tax=Comamonas odontotermitis TaxID=379895 RepID=UPI003751AF42